MSEWEPFLVDYNVLWRAAEAWHAQASEVEVAARAVERLDSSGFSSEVKDSVTGFLTTWSDAVRATARATEELAEAVDAGRNAYMTNDYDGAEDLHQYLGLLP